MATRLVQPWRHWMDADKKLYLVIDVPHDATGAVVLMQVINYKDDEEVLVQRIPYSDWVTITEEEKTLTRCTPRLM